MTHLNAPKMGRCPADQDPSRTRQGNIDLPIMQDDRAALERSSQSRWCSPGRRNRPITPGSLLRFEYETRGLESPPLPKPRPKARETGQSRGPAAQDRNAEIRTRRWPPRRTRSTAATRHPRQNHNAIELHACTVAVGRGYAARSRRLAARRRTAPGASPMHSGSTEEQVRVTSPFVGGGFGGKCLWWHQVLGAGAAKLAGRPVRLTLSREGVYRMVGGRVRPSSASPWARRRRHFDALIHSGTAAITPHNKCPSRSAFRPMSAYASGSLKVNAGNCLRGHAGKYLHAGARQIVRHLRAGKRDRRTRA